MQRSFEIDDFLTKKKERYRKIKEINFKSFFYNEVIFRRKNKYLSFLLLAAKILF